MVRVIATDLDGTLLKPKKKFSLIEKENYNFGKYLSGFAKKVVLVGSYGAYNVRLGLLENGFNFNDIIMCKTLDEAKEKLGEIVSEGDVVLFENDLPDRFL